MKLSEAIRKGSAITRPTRDVGAFAWMTERGGVCYACVIGAAWAAFTGANVQKFYAAVDEIPGDGTTLDKLAVKMGVNAAVLREAQNRYEHSDYTREQVADWVEEQERKQGLWRESDEAYTKRVLGEIEKSADLVAA